MSGWVQVWTLVGLSLAATVLVLWMMRRAWMVDEYRGRRRRPWGQLPAGKLDGGTGEYPVIQGRHRKEGRKDEPTRTLDLSNFRAGRAMVRPPWAR